MFKKNQNSKFEEKLRIKIEEVNEGQTNFSRNVVKVAKKIFGKTKA